MFKRFKHLTNLGTNMSQIKISTVKDLKAFFKSKAFKKEYKKIPAKHRDEFAILTLLNKHILRAKFKDVICQVTAVPGLLETYLKSLNCNCSYEIGKLLVPMVFDLSKIGHLKDTVYGSFGGGLSIDVFPCGDGSYELPYYNRTMQQLGTVAVDHSLMIDKVTDGISSTYQITVNVSKPELPQESFINLNVGMDDYYVQPSNHGDKVLDEDEVMEENFTILITESLSAAWMDKLNRDEAELRTGLTEWARKHLSNIVEVIDSESESTKLQIDATTVIEHTWKYVPNPEFGKVNDEDEYLFQVGYETRSFKGPLTITVVGEEIVLPVLGDQAKPNEDE